MRENKILLIEDNSDDEELTLRALKKGQFSATVDVVRDGAEALDYLFCRGTYAKRNSKDLPRFAFLDLKLPKIDGLEVLKQIRANPATIYLPVVVFTSSQESRDINAAYSYGANSYIVKPVDTTQFTDAIKQVGQYWLTFNEKL